MCVCVFGVINNMAILTERICGMSNLCVRVCPYCVVSTEMVFDRFIDFWLSIDIDPALFQRIQWRMIMKPTSLEQY